MKTLTDFFEIINIKNTLRTIIVLYVFKYCFFYGYGFTTSLTFGTLSLLALALASILTTGYLVRYLCADNLFNKKYTLSRKTAIKIAVFSGVLSLVSSILLTYIVNKWIYIFVLPLSLIICTAYFYLDKEKNFFSNIMHGFMISYSIILLWWFDFPIDVSNYHWKLIDMLQSIVPLCILFAFLYNVALEITKDIDSINEDNLIGHKTLPIIIGRSRAKNIVLGITIFVLLIAVLLLMVFVKHTYLKIAISFCFLIPQLWFSYQLINTDTNQKYAKLLTKIKVVYGFAVIFIPLLGYYFKYVS